MARDDENVDEMNDLPEQEERAMEVNDAQEMIDRLTEERDSYLDQLQRSRAEFINYRKRTDAEKLRLGELFTANTISQFLPVIDDWDRAMAAVPANERDDSWFSGIQMIQTKFQQLLEKAGVTVVDGEGASFDPAIHEAVSVDAGSKGEYVVEVYQKGYKLGDTLLRPAMVKTGDAAPEFDA